MKIFTVINTEPNRGNVDRVVNVLMAELGLVPPKVESEGFQEYRTTRQLLVYEDPETRIGVYKIHIFEDAYSKPHRQNFDTFSFSYWDRGLTERTLREDPMNVAIDKVRSVIEGPIVEVVKTDLSVERIREILESTTNH